MSDEQQCIEQLEQRIKELEEVLWKAVESNTASTNLVTQMLRYWKPRSQGNESKPPIPRVDPLLIEKDYW